MKPSLYDKRVRIETQANHETMGPFVKHYARMCLSRYHAEKLLKDFTLFNSMHVGDEYFLTLIHPTPGQDYIKDFEIMYDNWEDVNRQATLLTEQINQLKHEDRIRRKIAIRDHMRRNPITYTSITTEDIRRAVQQESFLRKFTDPLPWTSELLSIR